MFNSDLLDVGIGLILVFLSVSLICSAVREGIEGFMKTRAMDLERGIRELLNDPKGSGLATQFFQHPLIYSLFAGDYDPKSLQNSNRKTLPWSARKSLPSYIPSSSFAAAIIDIVGRGAAAANAASAAELSIDGIRKMAANIQNANVQRVVNSALDRSQGDFEAFRQNLEGWFDGTMDRVSGWYKRRTQLYLFVIGFLSAASLNVDAIEVYKQLSTDATLRKAVVAQAEAVNQAGLEAQEQKSIDQLQREVAAIGYPIGWWGFWPDPQSRPANCSDPNDPAQCPRSLTFGTTLQIILGWLITAFAVMLGAPFWFDMLNKFMVIRSTVKPREKSQEEGSEDRPLSASGRKANISAGTQTSGPATGMAGQGAPGYVPNSWKDGLEEGVL